MSDAKDGKDKAGGGARELPATRGATSGADLRPGDSCGDYEVEAFVAAGGMGVVYKAKGKFGGLIVALKCIRRQLLERADMLERFETEARILAQLSSKNRYIVRLLHAGKHEGIPFIVMEWLDGVTLRDFLNHQREPIALKAALHYASCIARALCAAHAEGILHRDLKPENILMRKKSGLKVLDFGLGKLTEGDRVSTSERLGGMCTPHYSAPEQLDRSGVDERTDVYALALIVMEMLTGRYAFADASRELPDRQTAWANQFAAEPNSLRALRPECSASLAELIDRALSKDKTKRPGSAELLATLLQEQANVAAKAGAEAPTLDVEDSDDEDGGDENSVDDCVDAPSLPPAERISEPAHETSLIRRLPKLKTDVLPADFESPDPTAIGNPLPPPLPPLPPQKTAKMPPSPPAPNRGAERVSGAASSATQNAWAVPESDGETSSGGRCATVPPEPGTHMVGPAAEPTPAPQGAPDAPNPMPASPSAAPSEMNDSPATRASIELANRPTSPWIRPAPQGGPVSATPAPTQRGVPTASADATGKPIPMWPAVVIGVSVALAGFAILIAVRDHGPNRHVGVPSTSSPAVASAASASPNAVVATSASVALAEPAVAPMPVASVEATPAAPATPVATGAPSASAAPAVKVATPPEPNFFRKKPDAPAPAARQPAPAPPAKPAAAQPAPAPPAKPPTAAPTASVSRRLFGSEN